MSDNIRRAILIIVVALIGCAIYLLDDSVTGGSAAAEIRSAGQYVAEKESYPRAKEIVAPAGFVNTDGLPVTIAEHIGKSVILVDFLTYSCINCVRVQPYLNAWHDKYKDSGLVIIGIHTPEFEFEKDIDNVTRAMRDMEVEYPIVLDNDYGTWRAYQNSYWPRKYIIDIDGYVVYDHIGEGGYEETERTIQRLLRERQTRLGTEDGIAGDIFTPEELTAIGDGMPRTPEIYFGAWRNSRYAGNIAGGVTGIQEKPIPAVMNHTNRFYLIGKWDIQDEYAQNIGTAGISLNYQAKDIYMVASSEEGAEIDIHVNGQLVKSLHIRNDELYTILKGAEWSEGTLDIFITEGELKAFTFTFG